MAFDLHHFFGGDTHVVPNGHGGADQFDGSGHRVGYSMGTPDHGLDQYDAMGVKVGHLAPNLSGGGFSEYDRFGHLTGRVDAGIDGSLSHHDADGRLSHRTHARADGGHEVYNAMGGHVATVSPDHFGGLSLHGDPLATAQPFGFPPFGG